MEFGAATPRRRQIDLNLIPGEFRRRQFPILTAGLALVLVGCLLLLYGLFYLKSYADMEIAAFSSRIASAQGAVQAATTSEDAARQLAQANASQRSDYAALSERQVLWSRVLQAVTSPPDGVNVSEISQAGYTVSVVGSAPDYGQAVQFLEALRATDLFSNSSIELVDSSILAGTATPRASFGTPTTTQPAGVAVLGTPTIPIYLTPTPTTIPTATATAPPTVTSTPNFVATATAAARYTATARAQATSIAVAQKTSTAAAKKTATAIARLYATATKTRVPTATRVRTATPITTMLLPIATAEVANVGNTVSVTGHGPDQAVDGTPTTGWVPKPASGNSGRWIRVDLRNSTWYTPGTDVIWSVKIVPYRSLVSGSLPATSTGRYFVYTYSSSGTRTQRCDRQGVNWAQSQADTCWSASSSHNAPLSDVAVLDIGIPSSNPTDANWLQGIADIVIEVDHRPPGVSAVAALGPVGLGADEDLGSPTITLSETPTPAVGSLVGTPTPTAPALPFPSTPQPTPAFGVFPTPSVSPTPTATGPADFLILLEVKPGAGYVGVGQK